LNHLTTTKEISQQYLFLFPSFFLFFFINKKFVYKLLCNDSQYVEGIDIKGNHISAHRSTAGSNSPFTNIPINVESPVEMNNSSLTLNNNEFSLINSSISFKSNNSGSNFQFYLKNNSFSFATPINSSVKKCLQINENTISSSTTTKENISVEKVEPSYILSSSPFITNSFSTQIVDAGDLYIVNIPILIEFYCLLYKLFSFYMFY
jgi:hypothetical protein